MANKIISTLTELAEGPALADLLAVSDVSDTTEAPTGTTKKNKAQYALGSQVNAQTGTTYTYLTTDFRKLVTHTNGAAIAGTLPQAGASFPAGWFTFVQNRGAGALTITPTTSTIDGAASLALNQNEGVLIVSDGTNYFTMRGKDTGVAPVSGSPFEMVVACSDLTTALTVGTAKITFPWPRAVTLTSVHAYLVTPQTSGTIFTVDVNEAGVSILSTKITIDNGEADSTTAATAPVVSDSALAAMAAITVDIDQVGDGTAKGLYLVFVGTRA